MNLIPLFVDRALHGRCAICNHRLRSKAIVLYSASTVAWEKDNPAGEVEGDVEVKVCGDECFNLWEAGEIQVPA